MLESTRCGRGGPTRRRIPPAITIMGVLILGSCLQPPIRLMGIGVLRKSRIDCPLKTCPGKAGKGPGRHFHKCGECGLQWELKRCDTCELMGARTPSMDAYYCNKAHPTPVAG